METRQAAQCGEGLSYSPHIPDDWDETCWCIVIIAAFLLYLRFVLN